MTARSEFLRGLQLAGGRPDGEPEQPTPAVEPVDLHPLDQDIAARARRLEAKYGSEPVR